MMNRDEVIDLLSAITAYDNRNATAETVMAWSKAAEIGRWTLPEALDAVHAHFAEDPAYLMPAHITQRVKERRQDRSMREQHRELTAPVNPVAQARIAQIIADVGSNLGWESGRDRSPLSVRCPYCGSAPKVRCVGKDGRALRQSVAHPARVDAQAKQWQEGA